MKVMVVEDSMAVRMRLVDMLEEIVGRQSVIEAASVNEATSNLGKHWPNLILLDLLLPDGNGFDVLMMLQKLNQTTQVLVMTAEPDEYTRKRALQLGASHFFDKTKDIYTLIDTVADIAGRFPAEFSRAKH